MKEVSTKEDIKGQEIKLLIDLEREKRYRVKGDTAALPNIPQQNIGNYL
jgi:hypothetical protein